MNLSSFSFHVAHRWQCNLSKGMRGSEERKQVLIKWDPHGADHDAHREWADHEEPQESEPGAAGSSQRGTLDPGFYQKRSVSLEHWWKKEVWGFIKHLPTDKKMHTFFFFLLKTQSTSVIQLDQWNTSYFIFQYLPLPMKVGVGFKLEAIVQTMLKRK